jgi:hypothetical protein
MESPRRAAALRCAIDGSAIPLAPMPPVAPALLRPCAPQPCPWKEATMVPILLWILGVPGLIILLLLILGIIRL